MLSPEVRRAERCATLSSCCGVTGEAVLTDSAVILLYAGMIGAGDFLSLFSMAVLPLLNGLLIVPMAGFAPRFGCRSLVIYSNVTALTGYLLTAAAAFFAGPAAAILMLAGLVIFSGCQTGFVAGWFPFIDTFLTPERRALFLGRMRFFHQLSAVAFLALLSAVIGKTPKIGTLQLALLAGAMVFAGRIWFISRVPIFASRTDRPGLSWSKGLHLAMHNRKLRKFSLYTVLLNTGIAATIPIMLLHLKNCCHAGDNVLVLMSAAAFAGMPAGYIAAHSMEVRFGRAAVFRLLHGLLLADMVLLLFIPSGTAGIVLAALALAVCNGCIAANSVIAGAEMMDIATPGNRTMAMAFWGMSYSGGNGIARLAASLLTASSLFTGTALGAFAFSRYQELLFAGMLFAAAALFFLPRKTR